MKGISHLPLHGGITHLLGNSQSNICKCGYEGELYSILLDATKYKSWSEKCVNPKVGSGCRVWHIGTWKSISNRECTLQYPTTPVEDTKREGGCLDAANFQKEE
jgi:hypothetical protein